MPEQLAFTMLEVTNPYFHQKQFENADKAENYDKHMSSEWGIMQLELVFQVFYQEEYGLTDKEIFGITGIFPSTISARRNEIEDGWIEGYTVQPLIVDGKPLKRDGGQVNCLKNNS